MLPDELQSIPGALEVRTDRGQDILYLDPAHLLAAARHVKDVLGYRRLSFITAVDWYPTEPRFEVVYNVHSLDRNHYLRLQARLHGPDYELDSVTSVWRAANWYEREVFDLLGIRFRQHPELRRILMPEDWEGHPLRKDYPLSGPR
jgi:NADH-quinone oxidoreductase subunit C